VNIKFLGDIHGDFEVARQACRKYPEADWIFQVGDMGFGFPHYKRHKGVLVPDPEASDPTEFDPRFRFIRGNHDKPEVCRGHAHYLGDYGVHEPTGIFFISGGESTDKEHRTAYVDWWPDEELSAVDFHKAVALYASVKPEVVISHECPSSLLWLLCSHHAEVSSTSDVLEIMLQIHRPKVWVFGHHHKIWRKEIEGTQFICAAINQVVKL